MSDDQYPSGRQPEHDGGPGQQYGGPGQQYGGPGWQSPGGPGWQQPAPGGPAGEPPLWAPWYGISFPKAFVRFWKKYVRFDGRASRSEYWWWVLWAFLASIVVNIIDGAIAGATGTTSTVTTPGYVGFQTMSSSPFAFSAASIWGLATLLPGVALLMRRLHDVDLSGWWWLLALIPIAGWIVILILTVQASKPGGQRFDRPDRG